MVSERREGKRHDGSESALEGCAEEPRRAPLEEYKDRPMPEVERVRKLPHVDNWRQGDQRVEKRHPRD